MLFKLYFNFFFSKEDVNKILEEFCNYRIKEFKNYKKKYDTNFLKKVVVGVHQNEEKITKIIEGFPYADDNTIQLKNNYTNIISIDLVLFRFLLITYLYLR